MANQFFNGPAPQQADFDTLNSNLTTINNKIGNVEKIEIWTESLNFSTFETNHSIAQIDISSFGFTDNKYGGIAYAPSNNFPICKISPDTASSANAIMYNAVRTTALNCIIVLFKYLY